MAADHDCIGSPFLRGLYNFFSWLAARHELETIDADRHSRSEIRHQPLAVQFGSYRYFFTCQAAVRSKCQGWVESMNERDLCVERPGQLNADLGGMGGDRVFIDGDQDL